jgi:RimJ/RimL family protein N-acetyltransferase
MDVILREVVPADVGIFCQHQQEAEAIRMAAVPARDRAAHAEHWARILRDPEVCARTVVVDGEVGGHVVSWLKDGRRAVGYWLGRRFWGRGTATAALRLFLEVIPVRPLYAHVAAHNLASIRVLEKCGFRVVERLAPGGDSVSEVVLALESSPGRAAAS